MQVNNLTSRPYSKPWQCLAKSRFAGSIILTYYFRVHNKGVLILFTENVKYLYNLTTFTELKRFIIISTILFGLTFTSFAQNKIAGYSSDPPAKLIKYYPNPATTAINFEFIRSYDKSYSLQLFNFMGKKVLEVVAPAQLTNLSLSGFYRGVYIFRLSDKNGNVIDSGKFQVVR